MLYIDRWVYSWHNLPLLLLHLWLSHDPPPSLDSIGANRFFLCSVRELKFKYLTPPFVLWFCDYFNYAADNSAKLLYQILHTFFLQEFSKLLLWYSCFLVFELVAAVIPLFQTRPLPKVMTVVMSDIIMDLCIFSILVLANKQDNNRTNYFLISSCNNARSN